MHFDLVSQRELIKIVDVDLHGEAGADARLGIYFTYSEKVVNVVNAMIENDVVERHIQMAVVVDPIFYDGFSRADNR